MAATGIDGIVIPISSIIKQHEGDKEFVNYMEDILKATENSVTIPIGLYECPDPYYKTLAPGIVFFPS
jgi:dihydrodipicolinate synthase/N-acetylneuraminate lyase